MSALTRRDLSKVLERRLKISHAEATRLLEACFSEISDCLALGEDVKLSSFGSFHVRRKKARIGRNPKTGIEVKIKPRRSLVFKTSSILKAALNKKAR